MLASSSISNVDFRWIFSFHLVRIMHYEQMMWCALTDHTIPCSTTAHIIFIGCHGDNTGIFVIWYTEAWPAVIFKVGLRMCQCLECWHDLLPSSHPMVVFQISLHWIVPANAKRCPNAVLMLGQRLRRWPNIKTTLGQRIMFDGVYVFKQFLN